LLLERERGHVDKLVAFPDGELGPDAFAGDGNPITMGRNPATTNPP